MKRNMFQCILAACVIFLIVSSVEAQSISFGPGGLRIRGTRGERVTIGHSGVNIREPQVLHYVESQNPGVVINEGNPVSQQQHHAHGQVIIHGKNGHRATPAQPTQSGNFIVTNEAAATFQSAAESAFASGDLDYAAQSVSMAIKKDGNNGLLHLFASHVYFAIGDYSAAARQIDVATRIVPFNQWGAVVRNIHRLDNRRHYEAQLHQLNRYLDNHPSNAEARVVLGFYSALNGERRVAGDQFSIVVNSHPRYQLARRLNSQFATREVSIQTAPPQRQGNGSVLIRNSPTRYGSGLRTGGVIQVDPGSTDSVKIDEHDGAVIGDGTLIDLVP